MIRRFKKHLLYQTGHLYVKEKFAPKTVIGTRVGHLNKQSGYILVGFMGKEECDEYNFNFDFDTKQEAISELQQAAQVACEAIEKAVDGKPSGKYIDMKTNSTRLWDKSDLN